MTYTNLSHTRIANMSLKKLAVPLMLTALMSGCATVYKSPGIETVKPANIAVLEHTDPVGSGMTIRFIDGKSRGFGIIERYELTPGNHSITAGLNLYGYHGNEITHSFTAKAGGTYSIKPLVSTKIMRWGFRIIDKATGKPVEHR